MLPGTHPALLAARFIGLFSISPGIHAGEPASTLKPEEPLPHPSSPPRWAVTAVRTTPAASSNRTTLGFAPRGGHRVRRRRP